MVMAYGLHWAGGAPGPNLPMAANGVWKHKTLPWVVDDYAKWGKAKNLSKVIIGLPLYGHAWPSASGQPGAKSLGKAKSVTYKKAVVEAPSKGGWKWDVASQSSYYAYKSGGKWTQTWVDTAKSFALRVAYLDQRGTQMGLWALGYADKSVPVWQSIQAFMDKGKQGGGGSPDAGSTDAGSTGTAGTDAGSTDAGSTDTAGTDAGSADAAGTDTAGTDTVALDTGAGDADVASTDGAAVDGGAVDGGAKGDATSNTTDSGPSDHGGGTPVDAVPDSLITTDGLAVDGRGAADAGEPIAANLAPKPDSGCSAWTATDHPSRGPGGGFLCLSLCLLCVAGIRWRARLGCGLNDSGECSS